MGKLLLPVSIADGSINNAASLPKIAEQALAFARAGADIVAPSDMMDGRILAIKQVSSFFFRPAPTKA